MIKLGIIYKGTPFTDSYRELTFEETWEGAACGHPFTKDEWKILCKQYPELLKDSKWEEITDNDDSSDMGLIVQ